MKTLLLSAALAVGVVTPFAVPSISMAATTHYCEGNTVHCESFALNCTENNGRFINLDATPQRSVHYSCELPDTASVTGAQPVNLFQQHGSAITSVVIIGDSDSGSDNNSGNDGGSGSSDNGPDTTTGGGSGTTGGDDGNGNIL